MFLRKLGLHQFFSPFIVASIVTIVETVFKQHSFLTVFPHWLLRFFVVWLFLLISSRFVNYFFQKTMSLKDFRSSYPLRLVLTSFVGALLMLPFYQWLFRTYNGEMYFLLHYIHPQNSAQNELLRRFYIIALIALPFWIIPNISWYAYQKRLADIIAKKEINNNTNNNESYYKKFIYNTLILSKPANNEYKNFTKLMGKDILAVKINSKDEVMVYTNKETKALKGKAYFIINKIKNNGGIQLGDKIWVKPDAVIEVKPVKNGYGIILSNGQNINLSNLSSKALLPKHFVERVFDDQQRQRA